MSSSNLDYKEIKPINPKRNQCWIFIRRSDTEAEALILWPPDAKSQLIRKDPGKYWGQEEKGTTEDKMVGWHRRINGHEFEQWEMVKDRETWHATVYGSQRVRHDWTIEQQPTTWISVPSPSPSHPSRLLPSPVLSSLRHTANSHWLSILHMAMYVSMSLSPYILLSPSSPTPSHVHRCMVLSHYSFNMHFSDG